MAYVSPRDITSIMRLVMNGKIIEMKPSLLQLISSRPFLGIDLEDLHTYLFTFYELWGSVGVIGIYKDVLFLRLFQFSLTKKAKVWLQ